MSNRQLAMVVVHCAIALADIVVACTDSMGGARARTKIASRQKFLKDYARLVRYGPEEFMQTRNM